MQLTLGDLFMRPLKIDKPIRLIELFGGIGSQAMALRNLGADFEHYRLVEFDKYPVASYNAIHGTNFEPMDIREVHAKDLGIVDTKHFTYLLTYLLISLSGLIPCRKTKGYDKRNRNTIRVTLGSREIVDGVLQTFRHI